MPRACLLGAGPAWGRTSVRAFHPTKRALSSLDAERGSSETDTERSGALQSGAWSGRCGGGPAGLPGLYFEPYRLGKKPRERVPLRYVWASVCGHQHPVDRRMEPPGRKGSVGEKQGGGNEAVFTGRPAFERTPLIKDEGARKGWECGGSPQATGDGVKPASSQDDGKVTTTSLMHNDMQETDPTLSQWG